MAHRKLPDPMTVPASEKRIALLAAAREFSTGLGRGGAIDLVIANAGRGLAGGLLTSDEKQWRQMYEVNVIGLVEVTKALVPHGGGDGEVGMGDAGECDGGEGVEVSVTVAAKDLMPGLEILYREAKEGYVAGLGK